MQRHDGYTKPDGYTDMPGTRLGQQGTYEEARRTSGHPTLADRAIAFTQMVDPDDLRTAPSESDRTGYCTQADEGLPDYSLREY